ncbi:ATP-binding protein [Streptomyces acidiscabies]|uniref:ATP-binding protein n=1 Tax=Streptomyces acidiscabies TaxID=42234 RepID=A0AAP6EKA2_9ACTN|nr:ATP-binding protein [Streptomyces acidiscabies]MBP5936747.1 ATP-binding protein [Streptomyces sp. LBUM 1476]MBZ3915247.1 ATP-binding protein [Streptomyces acidiscabies]MDX2966062.1 ATP-binding protein [Streptomyces acidiscabies]MDX3021309.1 ATP-binding protein [Streptomyces acidiscabies]MDX3793438.1 ATP-binding protein [Streptomyces acidiscabies]
MTTFREAPHCRQDRDLHATAGVERTAVRGFEVSFVPTPVQVGRMRKITSAHLRHWGLWALREAVTLAVSELVTNTVEHGQGKPAGLRVVTNAQELRVEVTDGNPAPARLREANAEEENGRGLLLIAALSKEWGVSSDGTMTWCSFAVPAADVRELAPAGGYLADGSSQVAVRPLAWESNWPMEPLPKGLNLFVRSALTSAAWSGDQSLGVGAVRELAGYAVKTLGDSAEEFVLGLAIGVDEALTVSVSVPVTVDFGQAMPGDPGLARVRVVAGEIVWRPWRNGEGTTASVRLPAAAPPSGSRTSSLVPSAQVDC